MRQSSTANFKMTSITVLLLCGTAIAQGRNPETKNADMATIDADMQAVLTQFEALGPKALKSLTAIEARLQPTPADAVAALLVQQGIDPVALKQNSGVAVEDVTYQGSRGDELPARIYRLSVPENPSSPVILYIHGGGWVIADLDTYDATPRALAEKTGAIVVSVHYRQAPEHKFPAAHDDTVAAYKWVLKSAQEWGGDAALVAIVGESAGGTMAVAIAMAARDMKAQAPLYVLAVYPVAGVDLDTASYRENAKAKPLDKAGMQWFFKQTAASEADLRDPRLDLVNADLAGLPPMTIITAEIDPLRSEGDLLAARLLAAGVKVTSRNYEGVAHEFFGMGAVVADAAAAQDFAAGELKQAFAAKPVPNNQFR